MIRLATGWSGEPITEHRTLEIDAGSIFARFWVRPFTRPYAFSDYGPLCFGFAWLSGMIFFARKRS